MDLFYRETGTGAPLILLHGLWGASENWLPVARMLGDRFRVILPDLRNHGRSPHKEVHDYEQMRQDVAEWIEGLHLPVKPYLAGHSMGGKVVMALLLKNPDIAAKSIILDVAPVNYSWGEEQERIFRFMRSVNLTDMGGRKELGTVIGKAFDTEREKQLVWKNLQKTREGFRWKINAEVLYQERHKIAGWPEEYGGLCYNGEVLFVKGECSPYISGPEMLKKNFPAALLTVIPDAGHWLHTEQPEKLSKVMRSYLSKGM